MTATPEARYHCRRCDLPRAEHEVRHIALGATTAPMCLACGGPARRTPDPKALAAGSRPLVPELMSSLGHVFCLDGILAAFALGAGAAFVNYIPLVGPLVSAGMILAYLFAMIQHAMKGDDSLPLPVDFISFSDLLVPFVRFGTALLVASAPALLGYYLRHGSQRISLQFAHGLLCLVTVGYVPAAVAQSALSTGCFGAVNPLPGISLIARIPRDYAVTVFVLASFGSVAVIVKGLAELGARSLSVIPVIPTLAASFVSLLMPMVMARALGILLRERKHELGL